MSRPGITAKLFIAFLSVTLIVVVAMVLTARYTFREDFLEYARERQQERVEALAEALAEYYRQSGNWSGLRTPDNWREFLEATARGPRRFGRHAYDRGDHGERGDHEEEDHERDDDEQHAASRLVPALLDDGGERVVGPELPNGSVERVAVRVDGATVGWLAYRPIERITDRLALRFQREQFEAAWITGLAVAALVTVVSLVLARGFLAPLRRLTQATHALTAGRFDTRVRDDSRRDELGQLARDFNHLAETLERNERLRRDFMADMSHELRTPYPCSAPSSRQCGMACAP